MNVAFYCPLKPPNHPNPSGDRRLARLFGQAIGMAGHRVLDTTPFRSRDASGNCDRQRRLQRLGERLAARLLRRWASGRPGDRPQVWFTYHAYHKAPDWLGPVVSRALDIPYVVAEVSVAPKQANGPWATGFLGTVQAVRSADALLFLNPDDEECVRPLMKKGARFVRFPPFIDTHRFKPGLARTHGRAKVSRALDLEPRVPWLIAVGMMRYGDKLASYEMLGQSLSLVGDADWRLLVVGDGEARIAVERSLARLSPQRVRYLGKLADDALASTLAACDVLVWPAVNEAFGMSLLESQSLGVPVVAGGARGVSSVVENGKTGLLVDTAAPAAFADAVRCLIESPELRERMGRAAREYVCGAHDLTTAARSLDRLFKRLRSDRA